MYPNGKLFNQNKISKERSREREDQVREISPIGLDCSDNSKKYQNIS